LPTQIGATRLGGVDLNTPRIRSTLAAVLALSAAPGGFTITNLTTKVQTITGQTNYTTRQAAYDLRKLRDRDLLANPGRSRRYTSHHNQPAPSLPFSRYANRSSHPSWPVSAAHAWDATPHLGRNPTPGTQPHTWAQVDRDYETLRINMQALFHDLGITTGTAAA
jgi:hypothetical protein